MATGTPRQPYASFPFVLELDGAPVAGFSECSGLTTELDVIEYREGDEQAATPKLPGLKTHANILLKRGLATPDLWQWHQAAIDGAITRRDGSIVLRSETGAPIRRYDFRQAWPTKWEGASLTAATNEIAIDTLELAVDRIEQAQ